MAVMFEHGIDASRQCVVAIENAPSHALITSVGAQPLELVIEVEDERGSLEPARRTQRARMKTDDKIGLAAKTD